MIDTKLTLSPISQEQAKSDLINLVMSMNLSEQT